MKKTLLLFLSLVAVANQLTASVVDLAMSIDDYTGTGSGPIRVPVNVPGIDLDGSLLTFLSAHAGYTLLLIDADGQVDYAAYIPAAQTFITLPSSLSGSYELRIIPDGSSFYFYGYVMF